MIAMDIDERIARLEIAVVHLIAAMHLRESAEGVDQYDNTTKERIQMETDARFPKPEFNSTEFIHQLEAPLPETVKIDGTSQRIGRLEGTVEVLANTISRYGSQFEGLAEDELPILERLAAIESSDRVRDDGDAKITLRRTG